MTYKHEENIQRLLATINRDIQNLASEVAGLTCNVMQLATLQAYSTAHETLDEMLHQTDLVCDLLYPDHECDGYKHLLSTECIDHKLLGEEDDK